MNKADLFKTLSSAQKTEFDKDIHTAIAKVLESAENYFQKWNHIKLHVRLENKIFLCVRMTIDQKGEILEDKFDIIRFKNVDQFLDSLIAVRKKREAKAA